MSASSAHPHPHPHVDTTAHQHDLHAVRHSHAFGAVGAEQRSRALAWVTALTLVTMAVELVAGYASASLALTADGWHMGSHAAALGGAWLAARLAQRAHGHADYAFGGWKIEVLAGYSSALTLAAVALWLAFDSVQRLVQPAPVAYSEAMVVAVLGLLVNLASAWLLSRGQRGRTHAAPDDHDGHPGHHDHAAHTDSRTSDHHGHGHSHGHHHGHGHDHNFRAAYVHVLADALTSVLAIAALAAGLVWQLHWADPAVALVGAAVIGNWAWGLVRDTARVLVDATAEPTLRDAVRSAIECDHDAQLADLHLWQVGPAAYAGALTVVADLPLEAAAYRTRLKAIHALKHVTVEVHRCPQAAMTGSAQPGR
jgi:cation diffusion facilitator family transporter